MSTCLSLDNYALISSADVVLAPIRKNDTTSSIDSGDDAKRRWSDALDTLLGWRKHADEIDPDCMESAIDYAYEQQDEGCLPPTSITATEDGQITFEWRAGRTIVLVSVVALGMLEYTEFQNSKVTVTKILRRNPSTRRLEIQSNQGKK